MPITGFDPGLPGRTTIAGAPAGHDARVLAEIALRAQGKPLLHIALDDVRAALLQDALAFFAPHCEVIAFPGWDCLPYDRISPHADLAAERIAALHRLQQPFTRPAVVLTSINAAAQKTLPPDILREAGLNAARGDELPIEKLRAFLAANGYNSASAVREPGEFAVRGGIVDLYPPGYGAPIRLDFFGDTIEQIRIFDALAQTTTGALERFHLGPMSEVLLNEASVAQFRSGYRELFGAVTGGDPLYEAVSEGRKFPGIEHWLGLFYPKLFSLFDYAPQAPVTLDPQAEEAIKARLAQIEDFYKARLSLFEASKRAKHGKNKNAAAMAAVYKPVPPERLYLDHAALDHAFEGRALGLLSPFAAVDGGIDAQGQRGRNFSGERAQQKEIEAFQSYAALQQGQNRRVAVACYSQGSAQRIAHLLKSHGTHMPDAPTDWEGMKKLDPKAIAPVILGLEHGFTSIDLTLVTEQDILGDRLVRPAKKRGKSAQFQLELGALETGDFVVHAEHGIGRYEGLEAVTVLGVAHDCVRLIYDGGDKLFVPVENLDALTRYGSADSGAVLDKLGGAGWQSRKSRVKKRLKDMAEALIKIAAERELKTGEYIEIAEGSYNEFAARFPYPETEDQAKAISDVLEDMASGKPMDRLVCGDVGFGKTEVALRAAFAATQAGLQVAVVVPTTLLARQHFNNFTERFKGFPMKIAQLSRMVTAKEAHETKELLKQGGVDIVVGTHALLAGDIAFRNLGLLVIDEEQHFGVKQKERLKQLRADVHVLTLTATPIPRTLQLALAGVRELSLVATPPLDRLAVRSFILPYDPLVIREALMREHFRGGQSFYVCPRIEDLAGVAEELRQLVSEAKLVTAHGRMSPTELDDIMTAFDAKQYDILLATNIIESGLDIPNANTIVIHRADMFGLAQLYQLRGRIGRAKLRGYAYFTYAPGMMLSQPAQQRLEVIETLEQLGAGFQLASHDMDIRGAGNLLGEEQSGHIREVGVELYQQMLEDAVATARASGAEEGGSERFTPQINLGMPVLIPETYVADLNVRLGLYRRLADVVEEAEIEAAAAEMIDRFGPLPPEVENLLETVAVKVLCRKAGIARVDAGPKGAVLSFHQDKFSRPERLVNWISAQAGTAKVRPDQKLVLMRAWDDATQRLSGMKAALGELAKMAV